MTRTALPLEVFSERARRHVDPGSPVPLRMMGARGMLPLAPADMVPLLYQLGLDPEPEVREAADAALAALPPDILQPVLAGPLPGPVLDHLADLRGHQVDALEAILRNPATLDATFVRIARTCNESISELIAQNEVRVLRCPPIIESLFLNVQARSSTIDRLIELARRHKLNFENLHALQAIVEDMRWEPPPADAPDDTTFQKLLQESVQHDEKLEAEDQALPEAEQIARRTREVEELDEDEGRNKTQNLAAKLTTMTIAQKVRLATLGSRADRDLLIKDGNRLVHMAAVTSPKNQPKDYVAWSGNKQMPDNVIAFIANSPKFRRNYTILIHLCNNPKTPLALAGRLIQNLHEKDLSQLIKNRNITGNLRRMAQALKEQRSKKKG
jgi:hypothetical protein